MDFDRFVKRSILVWLVGLDVCVVKLGGIVIMSVCWLGRVGCFLIYVCGDLVLLFGFFVVILRIKLWLRKVEFVFSFIRVVLILFWVFLLIRLVKELVVCVFN